MIDRSIDDSAFFDWLIDRVSGRVDWVDHWLTDWLTHLSSNSLIKWFFECLGDRSNTITITSESKHHQKLKTNAKHATNQQKRCAYSKLESKLSH